jgi:hypothetical protein
MTGLNFILQLPDEIKNKISTEWGSIGNFYRLVFDLNAQDYKLATQKPNGYEQQRADIEKTLYDIEEKLDEFGIDGRDVTTEISSDHGEIIVQRHVQNLDHHLRKFGTDFETLRKWMKDKYGI